MVLDKVNPKWALVWVLIGAAGFNSLMALGNTLTWFNITWFLSRAVYVSPPLNQLFLSAMPAGFGFEPADRVFLVTFQICKGHACGPPVS